MATNSDMLNRAIHVINEHYVGMLTTVDEHGVPHARWMGCSLADGGLSVLYTLTGRQTRKLSQIRTNPNVCWVFSSPDYREVVTLWGQAQVLEAPAMVQSVWDRLVDAARAYCLSTIEGEPEFAIVQTNVRRGEIICPRLDVFRPQPLEIASP